MNVHGARGRAEPAAGAAVEAPGVGSLSEQLAKSAGRKRIELLIRRGEAHRAMGRYANAGKDFKAALEGARADAHPRLEIVAMASLGYIRYLDGDAARAEPLLLSALNMADDLDIPLLHAFCANRLGSILFSQARRKEALDLYEDALVHARRSNDAGLTTAVYINLARARESTEASAIDLQRARKTVDFVSSTPERARLLVEMAVEGSRARTVEESVSFAHEALSEAFSLAVKIGSDRTISLSAGNLGRLYEKQGRLKEALDFTERALTAARRTGAHELLLQWEWLLARIFLHQGSRREAMAAGRRAVFHIQAIRQDIPIRYHDGRSSFRETLAPIYFGLADMLLREAAGESDEDARQILLREARDVVERIKRSEIRDYFNDPCIDARSRGVESLSPGVAVLYPIIFKDRLDVLVEVGGRLHRETTRVSEQELKNTATRLTRILRDPYGSMADRHWPGRQDRERGEVIRLNGRTRGASYEPLARKIFEWLIRPVLPILEKHGVSTLVYAPDGALRLLPLAVLWDGEHFLVERYDTVVAPGLTLLDPHPTPRENPRALLAGVSRPGPSV
ncbi:MAG: tetratricopeptide repeat protein, partial [Desulfobacterales bacterium]|nr:tetratricopeptide repeat protein [Desulfobacterales bacterium]